MAFPYELIDLTHTLHEGIPTWPGHCGFNHDLHIDYSDCDAQDQFRVMKIKMYSGIGTHMDAPSHCIPCGRFIHDFDVNELIMPCVVIDVSDKCHERYCLSLQDVENFERKYGLIPKGSCVFVKTGWSTFWNEPSKYHNNHVNPSVSPEAASIFLERGVNALGIDTLSSDLAENGFKVHKIFLGAGKILIENVANLDHMPAVGTFVMIFPMKIKDGTEAPVRLVGLVKKTSEIKF